MKQLNKYIDHTNLKNTSKQEDIENLCKEAREMNFASVCVNPCYVDLTKKLLKGSDVLTCTVIGFPLGANTTLVKAYETEDAYNRGCDEFDMVINIGKLKDGFYDYVRKDIEAVVKAAKGRTVKVIIETGLLSDEEKVIACQLSYEAGAHYVKTCTGMSVGKAKCSDVILMKNSINENMKVKASAGIRSHDEAIKLIEAGANRLGTSSGVSIIKG